MWQQTYAPVAQSLGWSAAIAAFPVLVVLVALGVLRVSAWKASVAGLLGAIAVALFAYHMPAGLVVSATAYGAAFGLFPIAWVVYSAILLYRITVDTGQFEIIKDSVGHITGDERLQALLIAFSFGAFIEGASGFGTPVAVAGAMLVGLGFAPFRAAALCLVANTCPVAFGSIGIPLVTLAGITGLPLHSLSAGVGRLCAPISFWIPAYLILIMGGWKSLRGVLPGAFVCGLSFAGTQFLVSNYLGAPLTDILASIASVLSLVVLLHFWKPAGAAGPVTRLKHSSGAVWRAWTPYILLVLFVLLWGDETIKHWLGVGTFQFAWPGLHDRILRVAPVTAHPSPYGAMYTLNLLTASGTACLFATIGAAVLLRVSPARFLKLAGETARQLGTAFLTMAAVLALAFLMNYSGATATLGLAFAATGAAFPFFSSLLGWLGVFLTGSDTSANALFGNLQVVTAGKLGFSPVLMAAANSSGGVMGKMISLQNIAVAAAATGLAARDENKLFRFTLKHSIFLATVVGLLTLFYAYAAPNWIR
ncbi:MAG TPA: lactate permease LctP family transporter [Bryobacteraceae bacterium]|jgi:lactate permease|nr:lactate permease LctP family transporter [Bryobacteraceae bacterium]